MNLEQFLRQDLQNLYQNESEHTRMLPKMMEAATSPELKSLLEEHLAETQQQIARIRQILSMLGESPGGTGHVTPGVRGLAAEGQEFMDLDDLSMRDVALIAAAQKLEHYEISCYGTARALARTLGMDEAANLLQTTLDEEEAADRRLTHVSLPLLKQVGQPETSGV